MKDARGKLLEFQGAETSLEVLLPQASRAQYCQEPQCNAIIYIYNKEGEQRTQAKFKLKLKL